MIIFENGCPSAVSESIKVGTVGENLAHTIEFLLMGISDSQMKFSIHLRFANGSVNSVIPDSVQKDESGTLVVWKIKKNDIFEHGFFELQIEGHSEGELVYQTEIIRMFADESLPVEDKEYVNPNSETLALRNETYEILNKIDVQNAQIAANAALIKSSNLDKKADKAATLDGYGITDAYSKAQTDALLEKKTDNADFIEGLNAKDDKTNKVESLLQITDNCVNYPSIAYLNNYYYNADEMDSELAEKYDASNFESGSGTLSADDISLSGKSGKFSYKKIGNIVYVNITATMQVPSGNTKNAVFSGLPYRISNGRTANQYVASLSAMPYRCYASGTSINFTPLSGSNLTPVLPVEGDTVWVTIIYEIS